MIDWKRKLTSRKFWLAVVSLVSGILLAFKVNGTTVDTISGVIMSAGAVVAYIIGEGMTDAAHGGAPVVTVLNGEGHSGDGNDEDEPAPAAAADDGDELVDADEN